VLKDSSGRRHNTTTRRDDRHHTQPKVWHHSKGTLPAGDGFHSMDQPGGTEKGQEGLASGVSRGIPEIKSSKTKYTNTQQGLPGIRVYLAHN
jgi:hypothetical protein